MQSIRILLLLFLVLISCKSIEKSESNHRYNKYVEVDQNINNLDYFYLTTTEDGDGKLKIEAIPQNSQESLNEKILDNAQKCTIDQNPEDCLYDILILHGNNISTFSNDMDLNSKITIQVAKIKQSLSQKQKLLTECNNSINENDQQSAISNQQSESSRNYELLAYISGSSILAITAFLITYAIVKTPQKDSKTKILSSISPVQTLDKPIKIVVYNNISPKEYSKLTIKERFYKTFFGHTVLVVKPTNGPEIIVSYPEKDSVSYWSSKTGFNSSQLAEKIPEDQRSEFYVSKSAYEQFVIQYRTSDIVYRPNDVFEILDANRRDFSSNAMTYLYDSEKPPKEYLDFLAQRRKDVKAFLEKEIPAIKDPDYILSRDEITTVLKKFNEINSKDVFSKYKKLSSTIKPQFYDDLIRYDIEDFLLQRYRIGGRIYYEGKLPFVAGYDKSGKSFVQMDPSFRFSESKIIEYFKSISIEAGISSESVRSIFIEVTSGLSDLSDQTIAKFEATLKVLSPTVQSLVSYTREATKQRKYYNALYDRYERNGKVNCAGAVCRSLEPLTGKKISRDFFPRRPQEVVNIAQKMLEASEVSRLSPEIRPKIRLSLAETSSPINSCKQNLNSIQQEITESLHNIISLINLKNSFNTLQQN